MRDMYALKRNFMGTVEARTLNENSMTILRPNARFSWNQLKCFSQVDLGTILAKH